jgi:O-methyltransferase
LKSALTRSLFDENFVPIEGRRSSRKGKVVAALQHALRARGLAVTRRIDSRDAFAESPPKQIRTAETLLGPAGLDNLQDCIEEVLRHDVRGDFIETGVWRGGAAIFMRGALAAYGDHERLVWAADSFTGLPPPSETRYPQDEREAFWAEESWLAVPLDVVKRNFERYGLLDDRVRFLVGWFHETLASAEIGRLSIIRLDGDMYGSTMDGLRFLYPKLSPGGYVIVDDYWLPNCRAAVDDYRAEHGITEELVHVDRAIVYWRRSA